MACPSENHEIPPPEISVIIATRNRRETLLSTLEELRVQSSGVALEVVVVDNASDDGTPRAVAELHPWARVLGLDRNTGVEAYNTGAAAARAPLLLILDDDARPQRGTLRAAADHMNLHRSVGAVSLHPRHPSSGVSEWPFLAPGPAVGGWPLLVAGCLVRRDAWTQVGGYEKDFFLYVNDTDFALKLLSAGWEVHCDPSWVVWHDTPTAIRRPVRWFELATRNRVWLARRHLRGAGAVVGALAAWGEAHVRAGLSSGRHAASIRGAWRGWRSPPPRLPDGVRPAGNIFWRLASVRLGRARRRRAGEASDAPA